MGTATSSLGARDSPLGCPFGEEIVAGVMPLSKERSFECHNNCVGHTYAQILSEPHWAIGDNSSGDERYCWWRTMNMLRDITPPHFWNKLTVNEQLRFPLP